MSSLKTRFAEFHKKFPYLNIEEQIINFAIFDGFDYFELYLSTNVSENIQTNIICNLPKLKKNFYKESDIKRVLIKLAKGDRKQFSIYKNGKLSQQKGRIIYKELYEKNIISRESTREKLPKAHKHKPLKKEFRGYVAEDKLRFTKNFDRFWYTFISVFENDENNAILQYIEKYLEKFVSFTFEELSNELIKESCYGLNIVDTGGYWDKKVEIDMLCECKNGEYIAGECKWTNQKICKNILRKLKSKSDTLNFNITKYALFSKNGFSNGFTRNIEDNVMLFDLEHFKRLNDDR